MRPISGSSGRPLQKLVQFVQKLVYLHKLFVKIDFSYRFTEPEPELELELEVGESDPTLILT